MLSIDHGRMHGINNAAAPESELRWLCMLRATLVHCPLPLPSPPHAEKLASQGSSKDLKSDSPRRTACFYPMCVSSISRQGILKEPGALKEAMASGTRLERRWQPAATNMIYNGYRFTNYKEATRSPSFPDNPPEPNMSTPETSLPKADVLTDNLHTSINAAPLTENAQPIKSNHALAHGSGRVS